MRDLLNAGRMIADELARSGLDLGSIEVRNGNRAADKSRTLLVKPAAWPIALEHHLEINREELTPTSAMQIANMISVHVGVLDRVMAVRSGLDDVIGTLNELTGGGCEVVLQMVNDMLSDTPSVVLALYANLIDDTLKRVRERVSIVTGTSQSEKQILDRLTQTETTRQKLISDAGSRLAALRICSVTAAAIRDNPAGWKPRIRKALGLQGPKDVEGFRDGVWMPRVNLDEKGRVQWRRDTLIVRDGMPQTLQAAIIGKPLSDVVDHPWLPKGAIVEWTNQRINEELYIHTTPRLNRMREAWEAVHIEPADALLSSFSIKVE